VKSYGPQDAAIIVVGEAPGREEVRLGIPFIGPSGQLLNRIVSQCGYDYERDVYRTNAVLCWPEGNATPDAIAVGCCRERLLAELRQHESSTVVTLGKEAKIDLVGADVPRGVWTTCFGKDVLPTWHPAYVLRKPSEFAALFRDIQTAFAGRKIALKPPQYTFVETLEELVKAVDTPPGPWAVDIETDNLRWYQTADHTADAILLVAVAYGEDQAFVIDANLLYDDRDARSVLRTAFHQHDIVMQNGKFDKNFILAHFNIDFEIEFDTLYAHYVLNENVPHGLKAMALEYLGLPDYEVDLVKKYLSSRNDEYSKVPEDQLRLYAAFDVCVTLRLYHILKRELHEKQLYDWPFRNVLMRSLPLAFNMEHWGIPIDVEHCRYWSGQLAKELDELVAEMRTLSAHDDLNPNSPIQLGKVIWDEMDLEVNTGTKIYKKTPRSTSSEAVSHLHGVPFVAKLLQYRHVAKMKSSYLDNLIEYADLRGFIHPDVRLEGTEIGRLSMRDPAAQTIPRPSDKYGRISRSAFIAPFGWQLVIADYSQAELRVLAALSGDPFLLKVYKEDRDLHTEVAIAMFGANFTKEQRVMCKMFNFAYAYGGTEHSFARDAGLPIDVARRFVRDYDANMAAARAWKFEQFRRAKRDGFVQTRFGRRRRFPLITAENLDEVRKSSVHMPIASTASDLTLLAAVSLYAGGVDVRLLVHDSIIALAPKESADEIAKRMVDTMVRVGNTYVPEVPWKADVETADRWCQAPERL
jgi:DNA polymerase-1